MGLFTSRKDTKIAAMAATSTASTAAGTLIAANGATVGRDRAMRIPTVSRARDLICSMAANLPWHHQLVQWTGEDIEYVPLPLEPWMDRPEQRVTRAHTVAWTVDDLFFHGRAHWYITARYADGRPAGFQRLPATDVLIEADTFANGVPVGPYTLNYIGTTIPATDVISFWSPIAPFLQTAARSLFIAERLDQAALRFASTPAALGWLRQVGGEPLSNDELQELAQAWQDARDLGSIAAINEFVEWNESSMDPSKMQLVEARQYQALEMSRAANIPPYLVGVNAAGFTYSNAEQSVRDLYLFGALPYILCISETLSSSEVTARGHVVRLEMRDSEMMPNNDESPREVPV